MENKYTKVIEFLDKHFKEIKINWDSCPIGEGEEFDIDGVKCGFGRMDRELDGDSVGDKYENGIELFDLCEILADGTWKSTDIIYGCDFRRSGSYYSDYYYDYERPRRVEQVTKTIEITEWVDV